MPISMGVDWKKVADKTKKRSKIKKCIDILSGVNDVRVKAPKVVSTKERLANR